MPPVGRTMPARPPDESADWRVLSLRAYVTPKCSGSKAKHRKSKKPDDTGNNIGRLPPSDYVLVFDCETATTPDQKLRFGAYQLRCRGHLIERGLFFEPAALSKNERIILEDFISKEILSEDGEEIKLLTRQEFVEKIFFDRAYYLGAQIVGFNLPFDISRLAVRHVNARGHMYGGFSFILINDKKWPTVSVRHLSQRASFISFTGIEYDNKPPEEAGHEHSEKSYRVDRGYFVDVKTLAAAFTSESHSLESLSTLLNIPHPKLATDRHGDILDPDYVRYAMRDVQATWECFEALARRFDALELAGTGLYDLYSEASLGKAYLKTMGVKPWRESQPDFPPDMIGRIMGTYYGGRAEVHIRRNITPIIHSDFLSMYPTVSTLMGLWRFVTARGIDFRDDTAAIRQFVEQCTPDTLQSPSFWQHLTGIVQVRPRNDLFPVRAHYSEDAQATIGLNYLTSDEPIWFTLADVLVSKLLTGRTPKILAGVRFVPQAPQDDLRSVTVAGKTIQPLTDDFYRSLIVHRLDITKALKSATGEEKDRRESDRLAIKILANATSYGIFVELNVKDHVRPQRAVIHDARGRQATISVNKFEEPGRYFHPLLGTLTTGAARLMLALAERQVIDQGLDWVFCDTDSIAIANPDNLPIEEFRRRVFAIQAWFERLNPYGQAKSILQLEKVNFPSGEDGNLGRLNPPYCLAVSAKRYVLFNRDASGNAVIRKASGHGLGHLLDPYNDPPEARRDWTKKVGVPRWQADVWREIIRAADAGMANQVRYDSLRNFNIAAASRYAATTLALLKWFDGYNGTGKGGTPRPYADQVKPFNFLLSMQIKSRMEMAQVDMQALHSPLWTRREPRPASPHFGDNREAEQQAFDRDRRELVPIPAHWLKSHARSLTRYHMHSEAKFLGDTPDGIGALRRRHVHVVATQPIGKEADNLDEREFIGGGEDDVIEYDFRRSDKAKLYAFVETMQRDHNISDRELAGRAHVSHHTLTVMHGRGCIAGATLRQLVYAVEVIGYERLIGKSDLTSWISNLKQLKKDLGSDKGIAEHLGVSRSQVTRMLGSERSITNRVKKALRDSSDKSKS